MQRERCHCVEVRHSYQISEPVSTSSDSVLLICPQENQQIVMKCLHLASITFEKNQVVCSAVGQEVGVLFCKHVPCDFAFLPGAVLFSRDVSVVTERMNTPAIINHRVLNYFSLYVGHLESKERLRIQPAQLFNFS